MLAVAMEATCLAGLVGTSQLDGRTHCAFKSASGDLVARVRPKTDTVQAAEMRVALEGIPVDEESGQT
jgi:hypothetical protein